MTQAHRYDVAVIGGGHNGLVAAGLLAKRGFKAVVLERRDVVGGAAVTEQPWGPDYRVSALAYVVSLLPPAIVAELELDKHGYRIFPQHGYFAPQRDGRFLQLHDEPARRREELSKFSAKDADAYERWDPWLGELARVLGPMLAVVPPKLGSKAPGDLLDALGLAWRLKGLSAQAVGDVTRLFTSSVADLLDDHFEAPQLKGVLSVSGIIGAWAGPRTPGTAYLMMHHKLGDIGHGKQGTWGFPEGGLGAVTQAMARAAQAQGVTIKTDAPVARILVQHGRAAGVALENGDEFHADVVVATCHPQLTFLKLVERSALPAPFLRAVETWKTRSGTVKINLALDKLPDFTCKPGFDPQVHGGTIVLAESPDELEAAFQDAAAGRPAQAPFADICIPSVFDKTLAPEGKHVMSLFTQWVPHPWAKAPDRAALAAYADRVIARVEAVAPGFTASILHRQVLGPHEMETGYGLVGGNIFHGELSVGQLFHMRPAPGWADYRTPLRGLYHASSATHGGGGVTGLPALKVLH
ncbi:MAG: NAD(P)/FAD-dependent oxidoreductase, partial [Deltaproteobacteria bacterium]|nr:NAD(P)/FAD-dependent oxidoreductase [Deltaproteobacteria bacterium]